MAEYLIAALLSAWRADDYWNKRLFVEFVTTHSEWSLSRGYSLPYEASEEVELEIKEKYLADNMRHVWGNP